MYYRTRPSCLKSRIFSKFPSRSGPRWVLEPEVTYNPVFKELLPKSASLPDWRQSCAMSTRSSRERIVRNCLTDEGRPLEVGLQERTSNRLSAAVDKSHGRERGRKRPGMDWVRCQARRGLQGNHYGSVETYLDDVKTAA